MPVPIKSLDLSLLSSKHNSAFKRLEDYDSGNYRPVTPPCKQKNEKTTASLPPKK